MTAPLVPAVPRDLRTRLSELDDAAARRDYTDLDVRALPDRDQLPDCPACGAALDVSAVFTSEGGVAVALRLRCPASADHDDRAGTFVFEVATRQLYRAPAEHLTLTVAEFREALRRAAAGESVDDIVAERRDMAE